MARKEPPHCTRCKGTGMRNCARAHLGVPGLCFGCDGSGSRADQLRKKAAEEAAEAEALVYSKAWATVCHTREAAGGSKIPDRDRRKAARDSFSSVRGFSTQDYADRFQITKAEAWAELCRWTEVYPYIPQGADQASGWTFAF